MATGAQGLGGGPSLPPTAWETQTQGINEVKKNEVLALVLDTMAEVIPFTKREYDELFKYKAESDRPTLHPLMFLRTSGLEPFRIPEDTWQPIFQELLDSLPDNVKGWLEWEMAKPFENRDPGYVMLYNVIAAIAKGIDWIDRANPPIRPNSPEAIDYINNTALPYFALNQALSQGQAVLDASQLWLSLAGPNYPHYDALSHILDQAGQLLDLLREVRRSAAEDRIDPETKSSLNALANSLDRLMEEYQKSSARELHIFGTHLATLATLTRAQALDTATPALLIGLSAAFEGFSSDASGAVRPSFDHLMDALLHGILSSVVLGPRAELQELQTLYNALAAFG